MQQTHLSTYILLGSSGIKLDIDVFKSVTLDFMLISDLVV